jgi:hypothetical protein
MIIIVYGSILSPPFFRSENKVRDIKLKTHYFISHIISCHEDEMLITILNCSLSRNINKSFLHNKIKSKVAQLFS